MNSLSLEAIRIVIFGDICYISVSVSDLFFLRTRSHVLVLIHRLVRRGTSKGKDYWWCSKPFR